MSPLIWLIRGLAIASIIAIVLAVAGVEQSREFDPQEFVPVSGHAYSIEIAPQNPILRVYDRMKWSAARLAEDGAPLGPWRSPRAEVSEFGAGRYGQQGGSIHFSASDNSDPRASGRLYRADYRVHVRIWFAAMISALTLALLFAGIWGRGRERGWRGARIRVERLFFSLPLGAIGTGAAGVAILLLLGTLLSSAELAGATLDRLKDFSRVLAVLGLSAASGVVIARGIRQGETRSGAWILQALVLLLLAMGIQQKLFNPLQIAGLVVGLGGTLWAMSRPSWRKRFETKISHWTSADAPGLDRRLRQVLFFSMALGLLQVIPEILLYWDQSGWADSHSYDRMAHRIATGERPFGSDLYMPIYQYGLAYFYWAFGHHYFVQQLVNMVLVLLMIAFVAGAAWILFRKPAVALLAGLFAALWEPLHHATWYTQIETWYIPIFAGSALALARYLDRRDVGALVVLALAAALVFNIRLQGAFYAAALGLAALFVVDLSWRLRFQHLVVFGLVFAAVGIVPWASRNLAVEGRFSPSSGQSTSYLAIYNDPRVPLYGIRYSEAGEVEREWSEQFPDEAERRVAQSQYLRDRLINHPDYFVKAAPWRLMAFYGLLPDGAVEPAGPRAMDWGSEGWSYLQSRARFWVPILISLLGWFATIGSRFNLLFAGLIFANVMVAFTVGFAEPRLCYPVLILHFLMGCAVFGPYAVAETRPEPARPILNWRPVLIAAAILVIFVMPLAHLLIGSGQLYRPIQAKSWFRQESVTIDPALPLLKPRDGKLTVAGEPIGELEAGKRYRARIRVTNYMHPPKYICCWSERDRRLRPDDSVQYFLGYLANEAEAKWDIALRYSGAEVVAPIREGALIDAVIKIDAVPESGKYPADDWAHVEKAIVVRQPGSNRR